MKDRLLAYFSLTKFRLNSLVLVTTALGFFLGTRGIYDYGLLAWTLLGTALCGFGATALNNYLERESDGLMRRTCLRALPCGKIQPAEALAFGVVLILGGVGLLCWQVNLITAFLGLLTCFLYVLVYTPLKRVTWLNTCIGAIPGAIPPMGGWAASSGDLDLGAWVLFCILFLWQHPHFYSIAWIYREDYRRAGLKMLPAIEPDGRRTFVQIIFCSILLTLISLLPSELRITGEVYFWGALILGLGMLSVAGLFVNSKSEAAARRLLRASLIYLPSLFVLIILDTNL